LVASSIPPWRRTWTPRWLLTVRDGKVVRHEAVRDDMTMFGQLGAFPPTLAMAARVGAWKLTRRDRHAAAEVSALSAEAAK